MITIGTSKGGYIVDDQLRMQQSGIFPGWKVTAWSRTGDGGLIAALASNWFGASLQRSNDGADWQPISDGPTYPEGRELNQIWTIASAGDRLYAGVDEAGLFFSDDNGTTWNDVPALNDWPTRGDWMPGLGGLCAHHVLSRGERVVVGISAVGMFVSDDRAASFEKRDIGVTKIAGEGDDIEAGRCVHSIVAHDGDPDLMWRQDHSGVYRTTDAGRSWARVESGLPSNFGFPIGRDRQSGRLYIVPMESDENRVSAEGRFRVFCSDDDGDSWQVSGTGWDDSPAFDAVLRNAMATDGEGTIVVGTTGGNLWATRDAGDTWIRADLQLPRILSVEIV